jgi:hypothetical protein
MRLVRKLLALELDCGIAPDVLRRAAAVFLYKTLDRGPGFWIASSSMTGRAARRYPTVDCTFKMEAVEQVDNSSLIAEPSQNKLLVANFPRTKPE